MSNDVIKQTSQHGAGIELVMRNGISSELLYLRQYVPPVHRKQLHEANPLKTTSRLDYLLVSAGHHFENELGELQGYLGLAAGTSIVSTRRSSQENPEVRYRAAWGGRAGCTYWVTRIVGLKVESLFLLSQQPLYPTTHAPQLAQAFLYTSVHQMTFAFGVMIKPGRR